VSGLAIILVPAGIIAALICFRWARWTALLFVLFTLWWFDGKYEEWKATQPVEISAQR
jgi:hypothetical protein